MVEFFKHRVTGRTTVYVDIGVTVELRKALAGPLGTAAHRAGVTGLSEKAARSTRNLSTQRFGRAGSSAASLANRVIQTVITASINRGFVDDTS